MSTPNDRTEDHEDTIVAMLADMTPEQLERARAAVVAICEEHPAAAAPPAGID